MSHHHHPLESRRQFLRRLWWHVTLAMAIMVVPLVVGVVGYMGLAGLGPVDAFLNASMILGGMGPVDPLPTDGAKIFAGVYALFAGTAFLVGVGVLATPVIHRLLKRLHLEDDGLADREASGTCSTIRATPAPEMPTR